MLIQPEANLSALIESTKDLIWSVDLEGRLIAFNSALSRNALEIHGVQLKAGMEPSGGLSPEIAELWPSLFERALREGPFSIEFMLADGRTLELAFNRIAADGKTTGISVFGKDITKRKAAEIALREAEKRYRVIFDGAVEGIFQSSPEGNVLMVNRAAVKILGYDSLEDFQALVTNLREQLWVDREDSAKFRRQIREQGAIQDFECRLRRKDGTIFWSLLSARKISDVDGQFLYVEGFILDITERKQAEAELRDSELSYRATIEQAAVGIAQISFEGKYLRCNARFVEIAGYPLEEVPSLTVERVTHPADRAINESVRVRLAKGEIDHVHFEERLVRKDGSLTWVRMTTWPQRDSKGNMLYMVSLAEDINAQKAAETQLAAAQEALRLSEEHYRVAFQTSIDAITILNITNEKIVDVNQAALRMFGYVREEVLGRTFAELNLWSSPHDRPRLIEALRKENTCKDMEFHLHKKGGQKLWVQISGSRIMLVGVSSIHLVIRDISEAKASAEALRLSEERYRAVFEASIDAIAILRISDNKFVDCNQALLDDLGYKRDEVIGRTPRELGIWANSDDEGIMMKLAHENSIYRRSEFQFKRKDGNIQWAEMSASEMEIHGVPHRLCITRDLSTVKAAEDEIRSLAFFDPLTGLPNRRMLMDRLRTLVTDDVTGVHSRALLLIDLDDFKMLNETLGHRKGDLLLQEIARRISACVHGSDTVSRLGGDEFAVLLEELSKVAAEAANQAKAVCSRILDAISQPYLIESHECLSAASIGVTIFGIQPNSTDDYLQQADIALHHAKSAGRNTFRFFSPDLQKAVNARATLEDELRQAIKNDQFVLYYQPQVELDRLMGAEALIRWNHPTRGLVQPDEFIPMAEETGLILPLGEWVLKTACAQLASWAALKPPPCNFVVAVNISALQFRQPEFVEQVLMALSSTGINAMTLKLELTESVFAENLDEVVWKMKELKSHKVSFSLDDFGTGYSSLTYLKRLPLDQLKIDRTFVRDMMVDATSGAIAQTIISMGRAMGLSVIAEGVETEEQRGFLTDLGCHAFQGYLFSRPLPLEEFQAYLQRSAKSV